MSSSVSLNRSQNTRSHQPAKTPRQQKACLELSFQSVSKRFGRVLANDEISFTVQAGGIHAVVGENGAGKSTLIKILSGYYQPDGGAIFLDGSKLALSSATRACQAGIGMVHQQLALVPSLSGFENVLLGDRRLGFFLNNKAWQARVSARAREFGFTFDLSCPVAALSIADRQKLEIFKLLWKEARVLILDEPTSQLTPLEADEILSILEGLADAGRIVILITHHISEVLRFARQVTVLRRGRCITTCQASTLTSEKLARLMVEMDDSLFAQASASQEKASSGNTILHLEKVSTRAAGDLRAFRALHDIDFSVGKGEVVGVAGISGSGQNELGQLVAGLLPQASGQVSWTGAAKKGALRHKVAYIPCDQKQGSVPSLSLRANCFLKSANESWSHRFGFLRGKLMSAHTREIIESYDVRPGIPDLAAGALSGGNLQKLLVARELALGTELIVADNPCAGLDALVSTRVRQKLRQAADAGRGVVLVSPDLDELMAVCDRIVVMFNGRVIGQQAACDFDFQKLALLLGGKA